MLARSDGGLGMHVTWFFLLEGLLEYEYGTIDKGSRIWWYCCQDDWRCDQVVRCWECMPVTLHTIEHDTLVDGLAQTTFQVIVARANLVYWVGAISGAGAEAPHMRYP